MDLQTKILEKDASYPGSDATPQQTVELANAFRASASTLLTTKAQRKHASFDLSPFRLCAIHAIELYLNAFLLARGLKPEKIRGQHHNVAERARIAQAKGLALRRKTYEHLVALVQNREYLTTRYQTDSERPLSQLNRLVATLDEIAKKVSKQI